MEDRHALNDDDYLAFCVATLAELKRLAAYHDHHMLSYLLEMSELEAADARKAARISSQKTRTG